MCLEPSPRLDVSFFEGLFTEEEVTEMATVWEVGRLLGVEPAKVKRWAKEFAEYLSLTARPAKGREPVLRGRPAGAGRRRRPSGVGQRRRRRSLRPQQRGAVRRAGGRDRPAQLPAL